MMRKWWLAMVLALAAVCIPTAVSLAGSGAVQVGNELVVPVGTVMNGDAVAVFSDVVVMGEVRGTAVAIAGDVRIDGQVSGDVVCIGGKVSLSENAVVKGEITIVGAGLERAPGATVGGSVNNVSIGRTFVFSPRHWDSRLMAFGSHDPLGYLFYLAGLYALALLTLSLFPRYVENVQGAIEENWGRDALVGAAVLLFLGPLTLLIAITIIGIPLAFLLWVAFFLAKIMGYVAFVNLLGQKISPSERPNRPAQLALGVLVLGLVRYVPIMGAVVSLAVTAVTLGAVADTRFGTKQP